MTQSIELDRINLGAPAAERDNTLAEYFVESGAFKGVQSGKKHTVLGNRGSGKSAIFRVMAERERASGSVVVEISPEDYSYEMLSSTLRSEKEGSWAKQGAYTAGWKYLLYLQIMKALNRSGSRFKKGPSATIYGYLRDNVKGEQTNPIGTLISFLKRMEGIKVASYEASVKTHELDKLYKLDELAHVIPSVIELCKKQRVLVFVDELDKGWDSSEDAKSFIAGLVQAANAINQHSENLKIVVSLRQELYDSIPTLYEDAQKYRDVMEFVSWDEPSLLNLVAVRIKHALPELMSKNDLEVWHAVFPETLDYRNSKSFNYLVDRTLYRPREIIQLVSDVIDQARKLRSVNIDYRIISAAEVGYSKARTQDIAAEYKFQYPGLLQVFETFRGRNYSFTRNEAETLALDISLSDSKSLDQATWARDQEADFILDVLWRIGFLRAQIVGGVKAKRRSGSQYVGSHQIDTINIRSVSRFQVHPMFRTFLSMKEGKGGDDQE